MKKLGLCLAVLLLTALCAQAARVDTLSVASPKMKRNIPVVVIVPEQALAGNSCPTLYLLHGHGGNAFTWPTIKPELPQMADRDGIIVVCPDGEASWYWDSPLRPESQFETFVVRELTAFRHKDLFGAAGSTSGGVDIRPFPQSWGMSNHLGKEAENQSRWDAHTVMTQLDRIQDGDLSLIIDCGTEDFFLEVNRKFHQELLRRGIRHDFIIRPGAHNINYWNNSIDYQWIFFRKYFKGYRDPAASK